MRVGGAFHARYGKNCRMLLFSPGRTELCGNHTDHQCGKVIAAAIKQGIAAAVGRNVSGRCRLFSEGFGYTELDITEPYAADKARAGSTAALILGTADYLSSKGYAVGGFDAELAQRCRQAAGFPPRRRLRCCVRLYSPHCTMMQGYHKWSLRRRLSMRRACILASRAGLWIRQHARLAACRCWTFRSLRAEER